MHNLQLLLIVGKRTCWGPELFVPRGLWVRDWLFTASSPGALIAFSCAKYCCARHPASYTQQYFAQEKAIRAPGDEAGLFINRVSTLKDFFLFEEIFAIGRKKKEMQNKRKYEGNFKKMEENRKNFNIS